MLPGCWTGTQVAMHLTNSRDVKEQNRSNCDYIMKLCIVPYYDLKNMNWKGCPKFDQGKVAILDFKMADGEFSLSAHIAAKM